MWGAGPGGEDGEVAGGGGLGEFASAGLVAMYVLSNPKPHDVLRHVPSVPDLGSAPHREGGRVNSGRRDRQVVRSPSPPYFIVVRGPLGVGKSTVSRELARRLAADHLSIDKILEEEGIEEWDDDRISLASFLAANRFAARGAAGSLREGRVAIVDGCFYWKEQLDDLVARVPGQPYVFSLEAPLSVCIARDRTRPLPPRDREPQGGDQQGPDAARAVHRLVAEVRVGISIDARGTVGSVVRRILKALRVEPPYSPVGQARRTRRSFVPLDH
jgi:predicted kinase